MQRRPPPTAASPSSSSRLRLLRFVTLTCLLFTDGTYSILRRYSRGVLREEYSVNEVLLLAEVIKLLFSYYMMTTTTTGTADGGGGGGGKDDDDDDAKDAASSTNRSGSTVARLFRLILNSRRMLVLATLYGVGNVLSYFSLARVGAGTFVVVANLKTLTTAIFSTWMLGNRYSRTQWRALVLLVVGVVLFVLPTLKLDDGGGSTDAMNDDDAGAASGGPSNGSDLVLGVAAEMVVVALSGYASIYFERAIKHDPFDIWERNFQLGFHSMLMYVALIGLETERVRSPSNWTPVALALSFLGAAGGLLVALSIKYGDSVLKTLAISGSIIYASVVDHMCLDGPMNGEMGLAAIVVVIAVLNYNLDATPTDPPATWSMNGDVDPSHRNEKAIEDDDDSEMLPITVRK
jgi:UDP-sugar transporter A1/2/3